MYWIPLAPLRDATLVLATAGQTLGSKNGLAEHISDKAMLCLFDNFEQVVDAGPELAGLLAECPNLDVLVTSRERLRVSGEQTYPVPPLAESDGEALFTTRARAVDPAFTPSESVRELCVRLDELPLALELAAARTALFSPEQLLEQALPAPRPAQGLARRRSAAADAARDDRVVVRPPLRRRADASSAGSPSSRAAAPTRLPMRSPRPIRTPCSRFSTRASCASVDASLGPRYWMLETIREYARREARGVGRGRATRTTSPRVLPRPRRGRRRAPQGRRVRARADRRGARQSSQRLRYRARARSRAGARAGREAWSLLEPARPLSRRTAEARGRSRGGSRCSSLRSRPCTQRSRQSRSLAGGSRRRRATRARGSRAREGTRRQKWVGLRAQPSRG